MRKVSIICPPTLCVLLLVTAQAFENSERFSVRSHAANSPAPALSFSWSMRERFGATDTNGLVEYHWNPKTQKYDDSYVHPTSWTVEFDACKSVPSNRILRWEIDGETLSNASCSFAHDFSALRTYTVRITATSSDGHIETVEQTIAPRDIFIVSIGDSYAAGQGSPDKPGLHARWIDKPCHRSALAGPARAALYAEKTDPHSSVTFISFACTGAGLQQGFLDVQNEGGRINKPQLNQLFDAAGERTIDALLVSIGGNDANFAKLVWKAIKLRHAETDHATDVLLNNGLATLPERFDRMAKKLNDPTNKARISNVFITEYPDIVRDESRDFCDHSVSAVDALDRISAAESEWALNKVIVPLDTAIAAQATLWGWNYVDGMLTGFGGDPSGVAHGFCADDKRWVNTLTDSLKHQGDQAGTVHPNPDGYLWYAQRLVQALVAKGVITH